MVLEVLKKCTVHGTVVKLPEQLDRKLYVDVKGKLEAIGGKWKGGKVMGFQFEQDPTDLLRAVAGGANINLKKQFQFFPTPESLAREMVRAWSGLKEGMKVLEPSAGRGNIVRAILADYPSMQVDCYELMDLNRFFLQQIPNVNLLGEDFLQAEEAEQYDCIIANPPFARNQDIDHIYKMYKLLKPRGRMTVIASRHWQIASERRERSFRAWLDSVQATVNLNARGTFDESGTNVETTLIVIDKS